MPATISERINALVEYSGLSIKALSERIGAKTPQTLYELIKGKTKSVSISVQDGILNQFPEVSKSWLLTGEGEMFISESTETPATSDKSNLIPFYDAQTTGGFDGLVSSSSEVAIIKGYIDAGGWFDGRETAAIRHVGNSMLEYPDGCVLAVREVRDSRLLVPGKVYVIETSEYRVTKRYQLGTTPETIALYSSNPEKYEDGRLVYEPFEILKDDVQRIFLVLGYIVNQSGEIRLIKPKN